MSHPAQSIYRSIVYTSLVILLGSLTACDSGVNKSSAPTGVPNQTASKPASSAANSEIGKLEGLTGSTMDSSTPPEPEAKRASQPEEPATNESYKSIADNQFYTADRQPLSTFSIDVDPASYSNVRRFINDGQLPPKDAVRIEEMVNYFPYDYPQPTGDKPFSINTEIASAPWNPQHKLVQIGLQGKKISMEKLPPNNLVFLLDVSGSMNEPNKLPLLKASLKLLVNELRPIDRVAVVVYAGSAGLVLTSTPGNQKDKIIAALDKLEAGGSTAGGEGIIQAYKVARENLLKDGNNRVILATDGDFNVGVSSDDGLVKLIEKERKGNVFLTVLGLGMGNLKDAKMEQLANKGNGNYAYIDNLMEAKKVLVKEFGSTLLTIAKDVKIQVEFNPKLVQAYRLIGYENRVLANQDFKDDKKDAGELGAGHAVTALYEVIPTGVKTDLKFAIPTAQTAADKETQIAANSNELMQVRLRYKAPKSDTSQLLTGKVDRSIAKPINTASNNLKFAAAVAAYGMNLRNSPYKGSSNFGSILELASQAKGADLDGYRAEFIRLVEKSKKLTKS
ncbi:VWA domain-containing protein [Chamaesiphon sp. VAR_48_metabat_135_sub]|uniref:vWA domain-containing protein n=1 Tax=Chamaesiphon sp. VAR_48_metabat_135_sub TaxID=2964699 RepID=UPI00286CE78D|nr:VWA domain-containing protein [Chamaesiphon sp. VAR_48_metabat_135_sub]